MLEDDIRKSIKKLDELLHDGRSNEAHAEAHELAFLFEKLLPRSDEISSLKGLNDYHDHHPLSAARMVPFSQEAREKETTRLATIEECARLIESGAGMAGLIDQDELDQQARYIRALRMLGGTPK
jgi:hypothetical protein